MNTEFNLYNIVRVKLEKCPQNILNEMNKQFRFLDFSKIKKCKARLYVKYKPNLTPPKNAITFGQFSAADQTIFWKSKHDGWINIDIASKKEIKILFSKNIKSIEVFYIVDIMIRNLVISSGFAFIHSSGVLIKNKSHLFLAWGGTGKTNIMLHLLSKGAKLLGDDTILIDNRGFIYPYPRPLNLLHYNFMSNSSILKKNISLKKLLLIYSAKFLEIVTFNSNKALIFRIISKIAKVLYSKVDEYIDVRDIFGKQSFPIMSSYDNNKVYFLINSKNNHPTIKSISPKEIAERMSVCLKWERNYFSDFFVAFEYAYPSKKLLIKEFLIDEKKIIENNMKKAKILKIVNIPSGFSSSKLSNLLGLDK